jgi:EAL domain-containing protein (putative c-di-GMP-specific phosphodiesterase class I)
VVLKKSEQSGTGREREATWYLEGYADQGRNWTIVIDVSPFVVGRQEGCHLRLASSEVSRHHAEICKRDGVLWIKEFGSTNGTFVNRQQLIGECSLDDGDILHFGPLEFRIRCATPVDDRPEEGEEAMTRAVTATSLPHGFVDCEEEFGEMLRRHAVVPHFQPIVRLSNQTIIGYELLGRTDFEGVPTTAWPLLQIARRLGKEIELSELFRRVGIQQAARSLGHGYQLFFNTVPAEITLRHLQLSLRELRLQVPSLPLAMEIHEAAVTDLTVMKRIKGLLDELDIQLVFDDFGSGQARLIELVEVAPDCLKFDISFIRNLHCQSHTARKLLLTLVNMVKDLNIQTLAEGVETEDEMQACTDFGFDFAQGYYFGRPEPRFRVVLP